MIHNILRNPGLLWQSKPHRRVPYLTNRDRVEQYLPFLDAGRRSPAIDASPLTPQRHYYIHLSPNGSQAGNF